MQEKAPLRERLQETVRETVGAEDIAKASSPSTKMLLALRAKGKHMYEGTVPAAVKARRRAQGKRARHARRVGR